MHQIGRRLLPCRYGYLPIGAVPIGSLGHPSGWGTALIVTAAIGVAPRFSRPTPGSFDCHARTIPSGCRAVPNRQT